MIVHCAYSSQWWITRATSWWRHQMETISALLAIYAGNSPVPGDFSAQRPVTRSFDVFFDLHPNKLLSKQWQGWWFETPSCLLWRHRNVITWRPLIVRGGFFTERTSNSMQQISNFIQLFWSPDVHVRICFGIFMTICNVIVHADGGRHIFVRQRSL